jgi:hypothetical protein
MKITQMVSLFLLAMLLTEGALAQRRPGPAPRGPRYDPPGPSPRPGPRYDPPRPRPTPRPDPRPAPRPYPRPVPRPHPRPVPYPAPRPVPYPIPYPQPTPGPSYQAACFYEDDNFRGRSFCVEPGQVVSNLSSYGVNDRFSSVIIPQGMSITVYEDASYSGQALTLYGHVSSLSDYGRFWNDRISSLIYR